MRQVHALSNTIARVSDLSQRSPIQHGIIRTVCTHNKRLRESGHQRTRVRLAQSIANDFNPAGSDRAIVSQSMSMPISTISFSHERPLYRL